MPVLQCNRYGEDEVKKLRSLALHHLNDIEEQGRRAYQYIDIQYTHTHHKHKAHPFVSSVLSIGVVQLVQRDQSRNPQKPDAAYIQILGLHNASSTTDLRWRSSGGRLRGCNADD